MTGPEEQGECHYDQAPVRGERTRTGAGATRAYRKGVAYAVMRYRFVLLPLLGVAACGDPGAAQRAHALARHAHSAEATHGYTHPIWIDVARECSRVMPWHTGFDDARSLRATIEAGRIAALHPPEHTDH